MDHAMKRRPVNAPLEVDGRVPHLMLFALLLLIRLLHQSRITPSFQVSLQAELHNPQPPTKDATGESVFRTIKSRQAGPYRRAMKLCSLRQAGISTFPYKI
jgi:hypothetical protein